MKRRKVDPIVNEGSKYLVSLSPNACCVAVAKGSSISFYQTGRLILGLKGQSTLRQKVYMCSVQVNERNFTEKRGCTGFLDEGDIRIGQNAIEVHLL